MGRLVLENDTGDMDGVRVQLGVERDGVVAGLETRDRGDNQIEGYVPRCSAFLRWGDRDVGTGDELQNFSRFEAPVRYHLCVLSLVSSKSLNPLFGSRIWRVLDKCAQELSAGNGHDIDVVSEHSKIGG